MSENQGIEQFIKTVYWGQSDFRKSAQRACARQETVRDPQGIPPNDAIPAYFDRLEKLFGGTTTTDERRREKYLNRFLTFVVYPNAVIKPENIDDKYIRGVILGNFAEQLGYEREDLQDNNCKTAVLEQFKRVMETPLESYNISSEERQEIQRMVIDTQKARLQDWATYLTSSEAIQNVPRAFRYWAFVEMMKLGDYDEQRKKFNKREPKTTAPFPELNQQALSYVFDAIQGREVGIILPQDEQTRLQNLIRSRNFGSLYAFFTEKLKSLRINEERLRVTQGEWRQFSEGSDPSAVTETLRSFNTGWCIAGEGYAENYLSHSDLYIYYSLDKDGKPTIPRCCIVFNRKEQTITEVRGILPQQHLDSYITAVAEEKLRELPNGIRWLETMQDMKKLAAIHWKHLKNEELTDDDLRFIYEVDRPIKVSGYGRDPRIEEILGKRNIKEDLVKVFDVSPDQISVTQEEALQGNIVYHHGDIDLRDFSSLKVVVLPRIVRGDLNLGSLTSLDGGRLPQHVGGYLDLGSLTSLDGVELPQHVGGYLDLGSLTSLDGVELPQHVGGSLNLRSLTSLEGGRLPQHVGGDLDLGSLTSLEGGRLPQHVGGDLDLGSLTSLDGVELPQHVGGSLNLRSLTSLEGVELPQHVGGDLNLRSLTSLEGVELPQHVRGYLNLRSLTSLDGVELPQHVGGYLDLGSLTSFDGVELPQHVGGSLNLRSLTSLDGVELPQHVGGYLDLGSLTSLEGGRLPQHVGGYLYLGSLTSLDGVELPQHVGWDLNLGSLTSLEGVELPQHVGGSLYLGSLTSLDGGRLPESIGGSLFVSSSFPKESIELLKKKHGEGKIRLI